MNDFNFCPVCGQAVVWRETHGAQRPVCTACGRVHFFDPKVAVAVVIEQDDSLLMIRRGVEPGRGLWALPAGYVDRGEDPARAAERETLEETDLNVQVSGPPKILIKSDPSEGADILLVYPAMLLSGEALARDDAAEVRWFTHDHVPTELAFDSTRRVLEQWVKRMQDKL